MKKIITEDFNELSLPDDLYEVDLNYDYKTADSEFTKTMTVNPNEYDLAEFLNTTHDKVNQKDIDNLNQNSFIEFLYIKHQNDSALHEAFDYYDEDFNLVEKKKKRKHGATVTYTTGCPALNIWHFNNCAGTNFPKKDPAEDIAKDISNGIAGDTAGGDTSGESLGDGLGDGGGMGESLTTDTKNSLTEMMGDRYQYFVDKTRKDFPDLYNDTQAKLNASKTKADDYAILSIFYSKLMDKAFDKWDLDDASELFNDSKAMMSMPESVGKQFCGHLFKINNLRILHDLDIYDGLALIQDIYDDPTDAEYASFYKDLVNSFNSDHLNESAPLTESSWVFDSCTCFDGYYVEYLWDKYKGYEVAAGELRKDGIVYDDYHKVCASKEEAKKIYDKLCAKHNNKVDINADESLQEDAKRVVKKYYIRPQNKFIGNKKELLAVLVELEDQNCSVYTLKNLTDNEDVAHLTNNDIIYYYDDGILYDKNHVRIMDYKLNIKNEEERDFINPDQVSDAKFAEVYADRLTIDNDIVKEGLTEDITDNTKVIICAKTDRAPNGQYILGCAYRVSGDLDAIKQFGKKAVTDYYEVAAEDAGVKAELIKDFEQEYLGRNQLGSKVQQVINKAILYRRDTGDIIDTIPYDFYFTEDDIIDTPVAVDESLLESQSQEIGDTYKRLSKLYNVNLNDLIYGKDGFMQARYPNGFPDFAGDIIYNETYWNEFESWLKDTKNITLDTSETTLESISLSDADLKEVYGENYVYNLEFNTLNEANENKHEEICCICGEPIKGYGNNPEPYKHDGKCCDACSMKFVIPARLAEIEQNKGK